MTASFALMKPSKSTAIALGLALGMAAGTFVAAPAFAGKAKVETQAAASDEQKAAAERVLYGRYQCEAGKSITVSRDTQNPGYVNLQLAKQGWTMKPVLSPTGAVRLEDVKGNTLLLQILTKSMLMDTKTQHRLVDGCAHDAQKAAEEELKKSPSPSALFDAPAQ